MNRSTLIRISGVVRISSFSSAWHGFRELESEETGGGRNLTWTPSPEIMTGGGRAAEAAVPRLQEIDI